MVGVTWAVKSGAIAEYVRAGDQFEAWSRFADRPAEDFGLIMSAEPDENGDPLLVRTSAMMFFWGRDEDALLFVKAAQDQGLHDTSEQDREFAARHRGEQSDE